MKRERKEVYSTQVRFQIINLNTGKTQEEFILNSPSRDKKLIVLFLFLWLPGSFVRKELSGQWVPSSLKVLFEKIVFFISFYLKFDAKVTFLIRLEHYFFFGQMGESIRNIHRLFVKTFKKSVKSKIRKKTNHFFCFSIRVNSDRSSAKQEEYAKAGS